MKNYVFFLAIISTTMAIKNAIPQVVLAPSAKEQEEGLKPQAFYKKNLKEMKEMIKNPTNVFDIKEELKSNYTDISIQKFTTSISKSGNLSQHNSNIKPFIMGGSTSTPGEQPWHAYLYILNDIYICGATIICESWLITTANCLEFAQSVGPEFGVVAGAQVWWSESEVGRQLRRGIGFPHPEHQIGTLVNDIALIKVDCPFHFGAQVQPVNLPRLCNLDDDFVDLTGEIAGWGSYDDWFFTLGDDLHHASVTVISNDDCEAFYGTTLDDCILCTLEDDTNGPCYGDYGGALVVPNSDVEDCGEQFPSSSSSHSSHSKSSHDSSDSKHGSSSSRGSYNSHRSHKSHRSHRRHHSSSHHDSSSSEECPVECKGCKSGYTMIAMYIFSPFDSCLDNPAGYVRITCYVSWIYAITGMKAC